MTVRTALSVYSITVSLSSSAVRNLAIVQEDYAYTGVMEIGTGIIDLCGVAGTNSHYSTITPLQSGTFPQYVGSKDVAPIVHGGAGSGNTSHQQLARCVLACGDRVASEEEDFCGFTVRFNAKPYAEFSGTSRSLNSGDGLVNGELESCLRTPIMASLSGILNLYGWSNCKHVPPRVTPDDAQKKRGGAVAGAGLFANLLANTTKIQ